MAKDAVINTRIDSSLKKEAENILQNIGLKPSEAINIFYRMIVAHKGLPFELRIPDEEFIDHAKASMEKNRRLGELLAK
ncbi:MAG: type II toxin-antitoxin system RelB/DinJ family antitoxin [Calditrichaceae bacterium]|nr:type II toxin-antitoxin system RelB/DinJ family antitoxin [Calditrichia bacterium]NUQ41745.1 type II toxin-antitoxin system RelB/DinJ family antitoxin [Calditrichaceae bacterium]